MSGAITFFSINKEIMNYRVLKCRYAMLTMPYRRLLLLWEGSSCGSSVLPEEKRGAGKGRGRMSPSMLPSTPKQQLLRGSKQLRHTGCDAVHPTVWLWLEP
jgi:hypothetical protein